MIVMNRKVLRILFLLWLGWYLSGPLFEMMDSWDTPQEEMIDIFWSAGGAVSLVAAGACIGILVFRKFRDLCCYLASSATSAEPARLLTFECPWVLSTIIPAPNLDISSSLRI
jgi:hypothetical protein